MGRCGRQCRRAWTEFTLRCQCELLAQMLANKQFVDARAQVFAKYGSTQWTLLGEFPVERQLIAK